jgi:hypothetical protein
MGNPWHHSLRSLLSYHRLSNNVTIKIHKSVILRVALYGCDTWSFTLREEQGAEENIWT